MLAALPLLATIGPLGGARSALPRPALSGPVEVVDRGAFRLHFTREGVDAVGDEDQDGDGLPDALSAALAGLEGGAEAFAAEGWRSLVGDTGDGGSEAIDVYFRELPVFGYAVPTPAPDGTASCFLQLDPANGVAGRVAESVALHELHHCVQFRYTTATASWIYEAAATFEQYAHVADPVLELAAGVLYGERLGHPERPLAAVDGRFEYAGFLWMKFWAERDGGDPARLPDLWEALAVEAAGGDVPGWQRALAAEAERLGSDLPGVFLEHAVWNGFACAGDDGAHYDPAVIPCVAQVTVPATPWDGGPLEVAHEDGPFTAAGFERAGGAVEERLSLRCAGEPGLRAAAVGLDADGRATVKDADTDGVLELVIPAGGVGRVVLVGTDAPLDAACTPLGEGRALSGACDTGGGVAPAAGWAIAWLAGRRGRRSRR